MKKLYCWLLFFIGSINLGWAQEVYQAHTHVQLVSEQDAAVTGKEFWVGLELHLDNGWHTYWKNPGDSGLAPKIKWTLPPGVTAGDIHWPYPMRLTTGPLTSFGYEHQVFLLVPINVSGNVQSKDIDLKAQVHWLTCDKEECIPGSAELNLLLPLTTDASGVKFNNFKKFFDQARQEEPRLISSIQSRVLLDGNQWHLSIATPYNKHGRIIFYPLHDDVIEHSVPQHSQLTPEGYQLNLTRSHLYQGLTKSLEGVAVDPEGWDNEGKIKAVIIQAPVEVARDQVPFVVACLFAAIGGLILNLMPCVLPVLSIKVLHLVERHPDRKIALRHSLIYALGILVSVWVLALLLFILKSAGQFAGWGFQFQSPAFCLFVAVVLFVLALNLFGVFEFSIPSIGGLHPPKPDYQASFISGVITTIVASPCTAPLMGTALTVGLSQPNLVGFGIFTSLGVGLALPFVLLSAFPFLLSFIPKPGVWMIYLKKVLGLILLACVVWLLWVFGIQTGLWDLSKFTKSSQGIQWQEYSAQAVVDARKSGHGVFIDFTADWCINCQVNDRLVLQNAQVVKAFRAQGIIAFKGDWTKYNPVVTEALASFGRDSIPVYVYYPPGAATPSILPQLITPKMISERVSRS
jgi:thiol:disulfide interchange protein DsbD